MRLWKLIGGIALLAVLLWLLSPTRSLPDHPAIVEITYLGDSGPNTPAVEDAIRIFEEESLQRHQRDPSQPIYRVISGQNASRDMTSDPTRFLVSVAGGEPPDLILFDRYAVSEWAARGAFTNLEPFIKADLAANEPDAIRPENYYKPAWEEVLYMDPVSGESGIYGVPERVDDRAFFYNKDLLKRAGFVDEHGEARPPRDWEELEEMAVKLTEFDSRGAITRLGFAPNYGNAWLYIYSWMNGGDFMSPDRRRVTLTSPPVLNALRWMVKVYDTLGGAEKVFAFQSSQQVGELDPFVSGKVAMKIDGYWNFPDNLAEFGQNLDYGLAVPPPPRHVRERGGTGTSWVSGWCFAIPSTARQKEAGWELLNFLASPRANEIIAESRRLTLESQGRIYVPTQNANRQINQWLYEKYILGNPAVQPKVREGVKLLNNLLETSPIRPVTPVGQLLFNEQKRATENAIFHKLSPEAALAESERIVQRQLDRALTPPRGPLVPWHYFIWVYLGLVVLACAAIYWWETRTPTRAPARLFPGWSRRAPTSQTRPEGRPAPVVAPPGAMITTAQMPAPAAVPPTADPNPTRNLSDRGEGTPAPIDHLGSRRAPTPEDAEHDHPPSQRYGAAGERAAPRLEGTRSPYFRSQWRGGWLCASPWIIGFIALTGGPILFAIVISFCDYDILNPARFIGFDNYRWMFTNDPLFWKSVGNTMFMVIGIPLGMALSLAIAMLLNLEIRGVALWRTFFYLPAIVPAVASSILWIWILNPNAGLLNSVLASFGINGPNWLQNEATSKWALILMGLWGAGGGMIIWLAGLKGISTSYYEAAEIDGASAWQRFRHITLPLLTPYIFFNLVMGLIGTLQIFTQAFIMTQGGPIDSTLFYAYHLFNSAFRFLQMGYASALGWFLFLVVFALTLLQLKTSKRWVHYEGD